MKSIIYLKVDQDSNQLLITKIESYYGSFSSIGSIFFFTLVFGIPCCLLCASLANNEGYSPLKLFRWRSPF